MKPEQEKAFAKLEDYYKWHKKSIQELYNKFDKVDEYAKENLPIEQRTHAFLSLSTFPEKVDENGDVTRTKSSITLVGNGRALNYLMCTQMENDDDFRTIVLHAVKTYLQKNMIGKIAEALDLEELSDVDKANPPA